MQIIEIKNNIPVVSHRIIAEYTGNEEESISRLIREHQSDFEEFGAVGFEIRTESLGLGNAFLDKQAQKTYYLNEQQVTLLLTYLRNTQIVREFKKALVREFYRLKNDQSQHQIPQTYSDALLLAANQAKEIEQQRKTIELQAPRIAFADKLQKSEGTLSIRDFAKLLCDKGLPLGEKRLFENLRALGLLDRTNKPYQYYVDMGVLTLKEGLYMNQTTGDAIAYTQVRVTAKGQEYIYNKLIA